MTKASNVRSALACLLLVACAADKKGEPSKTPSGGGVDTSDASTEMPPAPSDSDAFLMEYAAAVCAMYEPCCKSEGLGYDASGCTTWFRKVTAAYFRGNYSSDDAASCLSMLTEARAAGANRCASE